MGCLSFFEKSTSKDSIVKIQQMHRRFKQFAVSQQLHCLYLNPERSIINANCCRKVRTNIDCSRAMFDWLSCLYVSHENEYKRSRP